MNIELNVLGLIKNKLTASQYVMLNLLFQNKTELFVSYVNLYGFAKEEVQGLVDQGYILTCDPKNPLTCITIARDKVRKLLGIEESYFTELFDAYPLKVYNHKAVRALRPSSLTAKSAIVCKEKYDRVVKGNPLTHTYILACLLKEIELRKRGGNMAYMHALETYLNKNAWDAYASFLEAESNTSTSDTKYGEDLI
tara:strand:- start:3414 stop:4001 length:588 start_codon:yes stop_codon:yes gene_type:complete